MIKVQNLVKRYGDHVAVDGLSFTVEKGQIYGFLGPNGAGKSTTMNIITGCLAATEGVVLIDGHDIFADPIGAKACIGYLPEQPPLYMDMTPIEYLSFVAQIKGVAKAQRAQCVEDVMDKTGLFEVRHRLIKNLSKGFKQRVGLAQAILGDPKVIILDEPTVGLDPAQIVEIRALIKSLAPEHTVIFSSHILSEVQEICSRVLIISGGKLVAEDSPEELESRFVTQPELHISVQGSPEAVAEALSVVEGVDSLSIEDDPSSEGTVNITMSYTKGANVKAALSKALAERDCYIVRLEEGKASLEDVFMELIAQDAQPQETPDAEPEPEEIDADALLNGEMTSAYDEHEAFDAPKDAEDFDDVEAAENDAVEVGDDVTQNNAAVSAEDEAGQTAADADGEEGDDDGSDV